jgi:hypothetical protein
VIQAVYTMMIANAGIAHGGDRLAVVPTVRAWSV